MAPIAPRKPYNIVKLIMLISISLRPTVYLRASIKNPEKFG